MIPDDPAVPYQDRDRLLNVVNHFQLETCVKERLPGTASLLSSLIIMKLFYAPNTVALAAHITLEEAGANYEAVRLDFGQEEQRRAEYLAVNPKGRVPALVTEHGILTETPAILGYIAQRFPESQLAPPSDAFAFARLQSFNSYLCSTVHVAHAHGMRGYRWADEESSFADMKRKVPQTMGECFELMEREMFAGPWVLGDGYSICDPYLFTVTRWLESDRVDAERFPKIADHMRRMAERPAVGRVLAEQHGRKE